MTSSGFPEPTVFSARSVTPEVQAFVDRLQQQTLSRPPLGSPPPDGAPVFARPPKSPRARVIAVDAAGGRKVELRIVAPDNPRGAYLAIHGGGLVMGSADQDDAMLERIADSTGLAAVSVEYRLAPQHPYPAAWDDCEAAALWLANNVKAEFGGSALAIGGESAGATLAVPTLVRMRDKHGFTGFSAANLSYGNYDSTMTPSQSLIGQHGYFLRTADIQQCADLYAPDSSLRRNPDMSALYADLHDLPAALFSVGTMDPFLDDSLFLYARWIAAGNRAELEVYPGGTHGFNLMGHPLAGQVNARIDAFLKANT